MPFPFLHYDVFTRDPLTGNQLAVFLEGRGLSADRMRIFTPGVELPMAGHPTNGSTFALAHMGTIAPGTSRFVFGLGIGSTPVDLEWDASGLRFAWMTQRLPEFGPAVGHGVVPGAADTITGVTVGGEAVLVGRGDLLIS